jgi:hypothetical protein
MKRKPHSASLVLLLICIFAFWWGISVLSQSTMPAPMAMQNAADQSIDSGVLAPIVVRESVTGETHTYSGTFMQRSLCDSFGSGIRYNSESGGHVSILLISKASGTACAQAAGEITAEPFTVSIKLASNVQPVFDGVQLNGAVVPSQLIKGN